MEEFLNSVHNAKACFEKYKYEDLMAQDKRVVKHLCFEERKNLVEILMSDKLLTSRLINERVNVIANRTNEVNNARRAFLDNFNGDVNRQ